MASEALLLRARRHQWDDSIGISAKHPEQCCPSCGCCGSWEAFYFSYHNTNVHRGVGERSVCRPCCPSGHVQADLNGAAVNYGFDYHCCGTPTGTIAVTEASTGREIGSVDVNNRQYCRPCTCFGLCSEPDFVLVNVKDAQGRSRYTMREAGQLGCCGCPMCRMPNCCDDDCCSCSLCYVNFEHPIEGPVDGRTLAEPVGHITLRTPRFPCLSWCFPKWLGFREWPRHSTQEDKLLLVGMLHGALWMENGFARMM